MQFKRMLEDRHFGSNSATIKILNESTIHKLYPVLVYFYAAAHDIFEKPSIKRTETPLCETIRRLSYNGFKIVSPDDFSKKSNNSKSRNENANHGKPQHTQANS